MSDKFSYYIEQNDKYSNLPNIVEKNSVIDWDDVAFIVQCFAMLVYIVAACFIGDKLGDLLYAIGI